ncbi:MAG: SLC13 family permease [Gemmatimonadota bacterium]
MAVLLAVLAFAVTRPRGLPEAVLAVPAAVLVIAIGAISPAEALAEARRLGPVIGFLAAVLVLAELCDGEGLFRACGDWLSARGGRPERLLGQVFLIAAVTTAVLSLDATVVLLTPVVFAATARLGVRPRPHVYACTHLANSASLLLPVANLTNLLAFAASGLAFTRFAGLMALPWLAAVAVEYVVFRRFFAADLAAGRTGLAAGRDDLAAGQAAPGADRADLATGPAGPGVVPDAAGSTGPGGSADGDGSAGEGGVPGEAGVGGGGAARAGDRVPWLALAVVAATLAGFAVASAAGVSPAWSALAGAAVLSVRALAQRRTGPAALARAADIPFLLFVLALGIVVTAVVRHGLGTALGHVVPPGTSLAALLAVAGLAAVAANLINNLPATLVLLPLTAASGPGAVLAMLIGVNIGPNLTYAGSLATLLWRRVLHEHESGPSLREFTRLGLLTVPPGLVLAVLALWAALHVIGG